MANICKKLYNILQDNDHITYNITETDIEKLDLMVENTESLIFHSVTVPTAASML